MFREHLAHLIDKAHDLGVVAEADNIKEGFALIRKIKPAVAIIDISLKGSNGLELLKDLRAHGIDVPVLVLSMHDESLYALCSLRAGAQGYVMKQEALANVLTAIQQVFDGRPYLSAAMSAKLIVSYAEAPDNGKAAPTDNLSDRELEILELIGKGHEVREIAKELHLSPKTVETHRAHIKEKLNLKNARQVTRFAVQWMDARGA